MFQHYRIALIRFQFYNQVEVLNIKYKYLIVLQNLGFNKFVMIVLLKCLICIKRLIQVIKKLITNRMEAFRFTLTMELMTVQAKILYFLSVQLFTHTRRAQFAPTSLSTVVIKLKLLPVMQQL